MTAPPQSANMRPAQATTQRGASSYASAPGTRPTAKRTSKNPAAVMTRPSATAALGESDVAFTDLVGRLGAGADQAPDAILAAGHVGLALPRESGGPDPDAAHASRELAGRVDPRRAVHQAHLVHARARAHRVVDGEHGQQVLAERVLGERAVAVLLGHVGEDAPQVQRLEALGGGGRRRRREAGEGEAEQRASTNARPRCGAATGPPRGRSAGRPGGSGPAGGP